MVAVTAPKNHLEAYLQDLGRLLKVPKTDKQLFKTIVNAPFTDRGQTVRLDLGIVVLLLVNKKEGMIDRIALSNTEQAKEAVKMSAKRFHEIRIPLNHSKNIIAKAIEKGELQVTSDWYYLFTPELTAHQARFNQAGAGIECSIAHPLSVRDGGAMIFSFYQPPHNLGKDHYAFIEQYTALVNRILS